MPDQRPLRLCITGTRHATDSGSSTAFYWRPLVWDALDLWVHRFGRPAFMILGGDEKAPGTRSSRGIDLLALEWTEARGHEHVVQYAQWWKFGASAGPRRNNWMTSQLRPGDHLLAFPDAKSKGTWDCYRQAEGRMALCVAVKPGVDPLSERGWLTRLLKKKEAFDLGRTAL